MKICFVLPIISTVFSLSSYFCLAQSLTDNNSGEKNNAILLSWLMVRVNRWRIRNANPLDAFFIPQNKQNNSSCNTIIHIEFCLTVGRVSNIKHHVMVQCSAQKENGEFHSSIISVHWDSMMKQACNHPSCYSTCTVYIKANETVQMSSGLSLQSN